MPELTPEQMSRTTLESMLTDLRNSEDYTDRSMLRHSIAILAEFDRLTAAVSAARADERERCAKLAESMYANYIHGKQDAGNAIAAAIRTPPAPEGER